MITGYAVILIENEEESGDKARYEVPGTIPKKPFGPGGGFAQYGQSIRASVRNLWLGEGDYSNFFESMDIGIRRGLERAMREGMKEVGVNPRELPPEAQDKLTRLIQNELNYVDRFAEHIEANSKANDGPLAPLMQRSDMWTLTYLEAKNWGKLFGKPEMLQEWLRGPTKKPCTDALNLTGRVYKGKEWIKAGTVPQSRELECGGWKCGCGLFDTSKQRTPGPVPKLSGQKECPVAWWLDFDKLLEGEKGD